MSKHLQCPACGTDFGTDGRCSGCGADLSRLMEIATRSLHLRQQARQALRNRQYSKAHLLSTKAQGLHQTPIGQKLVQMARILNAVHIEASAV